MNKWQSTGGINWTEPGEDATGQPSPSALSAAAPELYAALEALLPPRRWQCWCDNPEGLGHEPKCMQARAALAKARGEKP